MELSDMAVTLEKNCAMLVHIDKPVSPSDIRTALEGHDTFAKIQSMQTAIKMLLSGEQLPAFFITVVRYVLPSEDHTIQKLLLLYLVSGFHGQVQLVTAPTLRPSGLIVAHQGLFGN